jgi:putative transposase
MTALLPGRPGQHSGATRLTRDVEDIVAAVIDEIYLSRQRPSIRYVATEVMLKCKAAGVEPPHHNTIRRRIARLPAPEKAKRRYGSRSKEARALAPITGGFPEPDQPYAAVQIDHTKLDIELVDDIYREPIGRPWLTLAIDVFSRMVAGFYVSIDPPGAMATVLAIVHAMLPKQIWLARHDISTPWPASGHIRMIHLDNAREFHGHMLDRGRGKDVS